MDRRTLLTSWQGLAGWLAAALAWPPLQLFVRGSRGAPGPASDVWGDLGFASRVVEGPWQARTIRLEARDRWRRDVREELVYVRRRAGEVEAVSAVCPHSGCLVRERAEGFDCPCHKSFFDADGRPREGPSLRPLDRLAVKTERGRVLVRYRRFRPGVASSEPIDA
jgi:Rieske Fe-S protein